MQIFHIMHFNSFKNQCKKVESNSYNMAHKFEILSPMNWFFSKYMDSFEKLLTLEGSVSFFSVE